MTQRRLALARVALVVAIGLPLGLADASPAAARDANPVDRFMRKMFGPPHRAKEPSRPRARQGAAKPKAAPAAAATAAAAAGAGAAAAVPLPSPDPRPEPATSETAASPPAKDDGMGKGTSAAGEADGAVTPAAKAAPAAPAAEGGSADAAPVPGQPNVVKPAVPAEAKPVEELPVPEARPAEAPAPASGGKAPVEGQAGAEPPKPEDAPNSTEKLKSRAPVIDPATSVVAAAAVEDAVACEAELKRRGAVFTVKPSISEGECGVLRPVSFERSSSGIRVGPETQMLCRAALALDIWLTDSVVPAAKASFPDRRLTEFRQASTYVCRPRASESGISEHARGSAIDIGSFAFDKGPEIGVAARDAGSPEAKFLDAVRSGACGPFKTVLGPGTDPDHATHFHLDIAARRNGATYCK